jgi:hypothetical protein
MKKLFVSAGLVALSAAALESAMADDATGPKYWSVGATLRGFYDDNYDLSTTQHGSAGIEFLPNISFHVPLQQTDLGIRYAYGLYYYQDRQDRGQQAFDQTHQVDLWLTHAFNEQWKAKVTDTFASGQEPELLNPNPVTGVATPYRLNGDNISNHGLISVDTDWTRLFSTTLSYNNGLFDYQDSGATLNSGTLMDGSVPGPSLAGILDRIEESAALDLKWHVLPETVAFIGYSFAWVNYTGDEPIAVVPLLNSTFIYHSSDRDSDTHYGYLGVQEQFTPNLTATVRGGASYTDVYGDPLFPSTSWAPYADVSLSYTYIPGSYVQLGFTHDISSSDQIAPNAAGQLTQYAENSVIYLDINHHITPKLLATVIGRVQYSTYQGGADSNFDSTDYGLGFNLSYQVNPHFSVDLGYNYDNLVSDIGGYSYSRNRVYLGVSANY